MRKQMEPDRKGRPDSDSDLARQRPRRRRLLYWDEQQMVALLGTALALEQRRLDATCQLYGHAFANPHDRRLADALVTYERTGGTTTDDLIDILVGSHRSDVIHRRQCRLVASNPPPPFKIRNHRITSEGHPRRVRRVRREEL